MASSAQASADLPGFQVSGCEDPLIARILKGTYAATLTRHHSKMVYKKTEQVDGTDVLVYFWNDPSSPEELGWWFAPTLGDPTVWAFAPTSGDRPPRGSWRVPWDGAVDSTLILMERPEVLPVAFSPLEAPMAIDSSDEEEALEEEEHCDPTSSSAEPAATVDPYGGVLQEHPSASSVDSGEPAVDIGGSAFRESAAEALQREINEVEAQLAAKEQGGVVKHAKAPPALPKSSFRSPAIVGQMPNDQTRVRPTQGMVAVSAGAPKPSRAARPIAVPATQGGLGRAEVATSTPSAPSQKPLPKPAPAQPSRAVAPTLTARGSASSKILLNDARQAATQAAMSKATVTKSNAAVPSRAALLVKRVAAVPPSAATNATSKAHVAKFNSKFPPAKASSGHGNMPVPPPCPPGRPLPGGQQEGPRPPRTPPPQEMVEASWTADWQKTGANSNHQMAGRLDATASHAAGNSTGWQQQQQQQQHKNHKKSNNDHKKNKPIPAWTPPSGDGRGDDQKRKAIPAWNHSEDEHGKRRRSDDEPIVGVDAEGRPYNLHSVVVNFANVGAFYARKVLKREPNMGDQMLFDWEGVRRCVMYLTNKLGLKVVGVIFENFWATDNDSQHKTQIPDDIRWICESIEETPRIVGRNHSSADDEMTIKCAYHRNCRFMDNDNYRDWKQQLRDEGCRAWLERCQDLLHMRYYFDSSIGVFETLDGNVPPGLLAPNGTKIPAAISKRELWTAPNR